MPVKSVGCQKGQLVLAKTDRGARVLLVLVPTMEGLHPTEAYFLLLVLKSLGSTTIKFVFEAASTNVKSALEEGDVAVVRDYLLKDYHPTPRVQCPGQSDFYSFNKLEKQFQDAAREALSETLGPKKSGHQNLTLISQIGPFLPSNGNLRFYKYAGIELYTTASMCVVGTAQRMGMLPLIIARVTNDEFRASKEPNASELAKVLLEGLNPVEEDLKKDIF